jgi:hypothetical protein
VLQKCYKPVTNLLQNMESIDKLKHLAQQYDRKRYPSMPDYARTIPKYKDTTANGLTKCIIDWIRFSGGHAERISITGRYIDNSRIVEDVLGNKRKIGSGKYIPSTMQKGSADISSTIPVTLANGKTWGLTAKWEVKMRDKQSEAQKKYQEQIERSGGYYFIVHSFDEFLEYYEQLMNETPF